MHLFFRKLDFSIAYNKTGRIKCKLKQQQLNTNNFCLDNSRCNNRILVFLNWGWSRMTLVSVKYEKKPSSSRKEIIRGSIVVVLVGNKFIRSWTFRVMKHFQWWRTRIGRFQDKPRNALIIDRSCWPHLRTDRNVWSLRPNKGRNESIVSLGRMAHWPVAGGRSGSGGQRTSDWNKRSRWRTFRGRCWAGGWNRWSRVRRLQNEPRDVGIINVGHRPAGLPTADVWIHFQRWRNGFKGFDNQPRDFAIVFGHFEVDSMTGRVSIIRGYGRLINFGGHLGDIIMIGDRQTNRGRHIFAYTNSYRPGLIGIGLQSVSNGMRRIRVVVRQRSGHFGDNILQWLDGSLCFTVGCICKMGRVICDGPLQRHSV